MLYNFTPQTALRKNAELLVTTRLLASQQMFYFAYILNYLLESTKILSKI